MGRLKPQKPPIQLEMPRPSKEEATGIHGHDGNVGSAACSAEVRASRPWLMPHQTRSRANGSVLARAINSSRTPIGGFANFDLAKAPR